MFIPKRFDYCVPLTGGLLRRFRVSFQPTTGRMRLTGLLTVSLVRLDLELELQLNSAQSCTKSDCHIQYADPFETTI